MKTQTQDEFVREVESRRWYHSMWLPGPEHPVLTEGEPFERVWDNIKLTMGLISYPQMIVLDIGTFDGKWAFEAERLGAKRVIATDCNWRAFDNFMFAHRALNSKVQPLFNVPLHELVRRLEPYSRGMHTGWGRHNGEEEQIKPEDTRFDIVQHLGVLYHLRDPMHSLLQCRSVMKDNAWLIIETACLPYEKEPVMLFNPRGKWRVYDDVTTWWAPSVQCLQEMLKGSLFDPQGYSIVEFDGSDIGRICMIARAQPFSEVDMKLLDEVFYNTYRTPGWGAV